jgi:hypothetical protein
MITINGIVFEETGIFKSSQLKVPFPSGNDIYWCCKKCMGIVSTMTDYGECKCGNIYIDIEMGVFIARDPERIELIKVVGQ